MSNGDRTEVDSAAIWLLAGVALACFAVEFVAVIVNLPAMLAVYAVKIWLFPTMASSQLWTFSVILTALLIASSWVFTRRVEGPAVGLSAIGVLGFAIFCALLVAKYGFLSSFPDALSAQFGLMKI